MSCETQKAIDLELSLVETAEIQAIEEKFGDDQDRKDRLDAYIRKARVLIAGGIRMCLCSLGLFDAARIVSSRTPQDLL